MHKLDRFAWDDYEHVVSERELEKLGIRLESVNEPFYPRDNTTSVCSIIVGGTYYRTGNSVWQVRIPEDNRYVKAGRLAGKS